MKDKMIEKEWLEETMGQVRSLNAERFIGKVEGDQAGPTIVFTAAMHGNEPSGVLACQKVFDIIERKQLKLRGNLYALVGNINAYHKGIRYEAEDMNRMWTPERLMREPKHAEEEEMQALNAELENILNKAVGTPYLFDLHTTSSPTPPFVVMHNNPKNRDFISTFPLAVVTDFEHVLEGALLSYMSDREVISMAYEAGWHNDPYSLHRQEAFIWLSLIHCGLIYHSDVPQVKKYEDLIRPEDERLQQIFRICYHYAIQPEEGFSMYPGYSNFQRIHKGELLAKNKDGEIRAKYSGRIFMPLYQHQGNDGFFIIEEVD